MWKFDKKSDEKSRDQICASLTRSDRSPNLNDPVARPRINAQSPCPGNPPCGANEANYPDSMGNPSLKPELASGVDVA